MDKVSFFLYFVNVWLVSVLSRNPFPTYSVLNKKELIMITYIIVKFLWYVLVLYFYNTLDRYKIKKANSEAIDLK